MDAIDTVRTALTPRIEKLIDQLNESGELMAAGFFTNILITLTNLKTEEELLGLFMELSTTAFQGFMFDETTWGMTDEILAYAEQVAHTFTASSGTAH